MDKPRFLSPPTLVAAGAALFFADSFLPWNRACRGGCLSFNLWQGFVGIEAALSDAALLFWQISILLGRDPPVGIEPERVTAAGTGLVLFFTLLKVSVDHTYLSVGAWFGLALALGIAFVGIGRVSRRFRRPPGPGVTGDPDETAGPAVA